MFDFTSKINWAITTGDQKGKALCVFKNPKRNITPGQENREKIRLSSCESEI